LPAKKLSACKPDSVSPAAVFAALGNGYHLSGCNITVTILLPTLPDTSTDVVNEQLTLMGS